MADSKEKKEAKVTGNLTQESIKVIGESIGINGLSDESTSQIAMDITYHLKQVVQEAVKFMQHGKRRKLNCMDIDNSLKVQNIEPLYGFRCQEYIPFRHASGGGREVFFNEEKEIDLQDIISSQLPKVPVDVTMKAHWLCIDGKQPAIAENPPPVSKELQKMEDVDPEIKAAINKPKLKISSEPGKLKLKPKVPEKVKLKELSTHELSVEQQLYYKEITEACVGSEEPRRSEALTSLSTDPGLHQMLPRFTTFISEGVKVNVVQNNLALLIYLMRMVKSLMDNTTLYLEKYLHDLVPTIATCVLSRQLCLRPDADNHWALRDFAARLMAQLCKIFNNSTNCIQARVTKMYSDALLSEKCSLSTHYGAIVGLQELGPEVMKTFLIPFLKMEGDRLQYCTEGPITTNIDRIATDHVKAAVIKSVPAVLKTMREAPDVLEEYKTEFGFLGPILHGAVVKLRMAPTTSTPVATSIINPFKSTTPLAFQQKTTSLLSPATTTLRTPARLTGQTISTPSTSGQKMIIMTSQPRSVSGISNHPVFTSGGSGSTSPAIMKLVNQGNSSQNSSQPKIVVMTMGGSASTLQQAAKTVTAGTSSMQDVGIKSIFSSSQPVRKDEL